MNLEGLESRLALIREAMLDIRVSGKIAPPMTWIQKYVVSKPSGKKYYYYRVMEATNKRSCTGSIQGKIKLYLGNKWNPKYQSYRKALERRNQLQLLQRRYDKLMAIYKAALAKVVGLGEFEGTSEAAGQEGSVCEPLLTSNTLGLAMSKIEALEKKIVQMKEGIEALALFLGLGTIESILSTG